MKTKRKQPSKTAARNGKPRKGTVRPKAGKKRRVPTLKRSKRMIAAATREKLSLDPEFRDLFPPLEADVYAGLKKSIDEQGCLDTLKVWVDGEKRILIDGYHRHKACQELDKPFQVQEMDFDTRLEAIMFVIDLHAGRRQLTAEQVSYYRGERANSLKQQHGGNRKTDQVVTSDNLKTREQIAAAEGVTTTTLDRDSRFAKDVNTVAEKVGPEVKAELLNGKVPATRQEVKKLAKASPKAAKAAVEKVKTGKAKTISEALPKAGSEKKTEWSDERDFINKVGPFARKIDEAYGLVCELVDQCAKITGAQGAQRVKNAANTAKGASQRALKDVFAAYKTWRAKK